MTLKAILIDLDDTLLATNMERFIPIYLRALGNKMKNFMEPEKLIELVLESTQIMMMNQDPSLTNEQVFYDHFNSRIDFSSSDFQAEVKEFYENDFPKLGKYTNSIYFARAFIENLFKDGYKVVIATNPLFPAKAIEHRIAWAGLSEFEFDLVTTYENSHFCKPNILYYQEILSKLEVSHHEAAMIGDDIDNDIRPAISLGMKTFLISNNVRHNSSGGLEKCLQWIKDQSK